MANLVANERIWSKFGQVYTNMRANLSFERGGKMIYIAANADLADKVYVDEEVALDAMGLQDRTDS